MRRLGRFFIVTPLSPPLTLGFPPTQGKSGRAMPALGFALRSSPSELLRGLGRFFAVTLRLFATAGFPPIRDKTGGLRPPGFYSSLRSIQPAHDGLALLCCHASPAHDARLPSVSGQPWQATPALHGYPSLRSIRAVRDGSALLFNTSAPLPQPSPKWCSLCRQWAGTPRCGFPAAATGVHHCPGGRS